MTQSAPLQPDQKPSNWDDHVDVYEAAFEPLTDMFAARALDALGTLRGLRLIDVGAGAGGAALEAARRGARVTAIDASAKMAARIAARAAAAGLTAIEAHAMDGARLDLPDAGFDAALSVFGVVLFPDAAGALREIHRVLLPGGCVALVTWTQPHRYELAARLRDAILAVRGAELPSTGLPAQLRYVDPDVFKALLAGGGFAIETVETIDAQWPVPSARWIAERLGFAPGLAAMLAALGPDRAAVLESFAAQLETDKGAGRIYLGAVAHVGIGVKS